MKENKAGEIPVSAFKDYYKARVSKTDIKRGQQNRIEIQEIDPTHI